MGDLRASSPEPNGVVSEDYWRRAEGATEGIINQVRPTLVSEDRRKAVILYVQRLIRSRVGCEVFPFGSVPLKTYLPDGDIDLTAVGGAVVEEVLANKVCSVLEREDQNDAAPFVVKDVQLIRAEVKLVKCLVQNIVVDISFNQLGGLSTLCFLEKVDYLIGKEHLFKRSIILIKAWCYYESRILGAHHGLISTYALETLVLYIFHVFNSSLNGPLAVLYKFLDYFSKFDWDNYCISLNGPVRISSLPEFVVETIENGASDLLLSNEFLKKCVDMFSVPMRGLETNSRTFPQKHLNIVDPLKENNNLGRSVSKGNFFRIRSAFTYGARKLGRILSQPEENVADELRKFFANTLVRHGSGQRPDVHDHIPVDGQHVFGAALRFQGMEYPQEDHSNSEFESADSDGTVKDCKLDEKQYFYGGANAIVSERQMSCSAAVNEVKNSSNGIAIAETRLFGDAKDLATAKGFSVSRNAHRSSAQNAKETSSPRGKTAHPPHLHFSGLSLRNGEIRNGNPELKHCEGSGSLNEDSIGLVNQDHSQLISNHEVMSPVGSANHPLLSHSVACPSEDHYTGHSCSHALVRPAESPDGTVFLADLCGDNESHLLNLYNSQCCYENTHLSSMSSPIHPQLRRNTFHWMNVNGAISGPYFPVNGPLVGFGMEEVPKTRGTGTYFPNTILQNHYRDRNYGSRGRNQGQMRSPRNNGQNSTFQERTSPEKNSHDASQAQYQGHQSGGKSGFPDHRHFGSAESKPYYNVNGSVTFPEKVVEQGSVAHLPPPQGSPLVQTSRHPVSAGPVHDSSISVPPAEMQKPEPLSIMDQDSISLQSYRLKDDGDFPPLSDSGGKGSPVPMVKKVEKAEQ